MRLLLVFLLLSSLSAQDRPNILWFVSEDNSPFLGCYGDSLALTPSLDAFARSGTRYLNAFSNAPVCAPSRSTLITGVLPTTLGSQHMRSLVTVRDAVQFFPRYLKDAGYYTSLRLKRDYNIPDQPGTWDIDEWWNVTDALPEWEEDQPFFMFYNTWITHEGELHNYEEKQLRYFRNTFERLSPDSLAALEAKLIPIDPDEVQLPPYLPDLPEVRQDLARYYGLMQLLDLEFASVMTDLDNRGLLENTIVIYTSDHGGVLGRSKRFPLESGLRVPMIVRFPEKYQHLAPTAPGGTTERVVSFLDFAPTFLRLAGIEPPAHFQGRDFLSEDEPKYAIGFRGRMDETYDMIRTIRDRQFRYVRHFMPHRPLGQRVNFLWKAPNVSAWEAAFRGGLTNVTQSTFFQPKVTEELYDCLNDPHNVHNLVGNPAYAGVKARMRMDLRNIMLDRKDSGLVPEAELFAAWEEKGIRYQDYAEQLPLSDILAVAEAVTNGAKVGQIRKWLQSPVAAIRYWATVGTLINPQPNGRLTKTLENALEDDSPAVRAVAAESLYLRGREQLATEAMAELLDHENPFVVLMIANTLEHTRSFTPEINKRIKEIAARDPKGRFDFAVRKCGYLETLLDG